MSETVCGPDAHWCTLMYHLTGSETVANVTAWFVAKALGIVILVIAALIAIWLAHRVINRLVKRTGKGRVTSVLPKRSGDQREVERSKAAEERRRQRAETMGAVLRSIATIVVVVVAAFMIIAQLGYNIGPLIASAGIVGVAIGFGAQSLVRDFVSGMFMIMEDQFGVGDWVVISGIYGEVEAVGLRVTRMRDLDGVVWYMRNGDVAAAGNLSQYWGRTVLDVQVAYTVDLDVAKQTLLDVGAELAADEAFAADITGEPEIWGVQSLDPDRVLVRFAMTTQPCMQWSIARELRGRIKDRFQADGIEIPLPQHVIHTADPAGSGPVASSRP